MEKARLAYRHETTLGAMGTLPPVVPFPEGVPRPPHVRTGVPREELLAYVRKLRLRAQKNLSQQRIRELYRKPVRIRSAFWEQLVRGLDRSLAIVERTAPGTTFTVERHGNP